MDHCAACDAKDRHIETLVDSNRLLLEQNRAINERLLELTSPGIGARLALQAAPREKRVKGTSTPATHNVGRLASVRAARATRRAETAATPAAGRAPEEIREEIERSFLPAVDVPSPDPPPTVEAE